MEIYRKLLNFVAKNKTKLKLPDASVVISSAQYHDVQK